MGHNDPRDEHPAKLQGCPQHVSGGLPPNSREAIIHGKLKTPTEIDATKIVVKCPSKYKEETSTANRDWKDYNKGGAGDQSVAPQKNVSPGAPEAVP